MYSAVFEPARMTAAQLEAGLATAYRAFYSRKRRLSRFRRFAKGRDKAVHLALSAANHHYATRYKHPHCAPDAGYEADPDDIQGLLAASSAPAQEALNVAFEAAVAGTPVSLTAKK